MALGFAAVVGEFKVSGPSFDVCLMHQADLHEAIKRSIDCHLVKSFLTHPSGDLFLRQRLVRPEQGLRTLTLPAVRYSLADFSI